MTPWSRGSLATPVGVNAGTDSNCFPALSVFVGISASSATHTGRSTDSARSCCCNGEHPIAANRSVARASGPSRTTAMSLQSLGPMLRSVPPLPNGIDCQRTETTPSGSPTNFANAFRSVLTVCGGAPPAEGPGGVDVGLRPQLVSKNNEPTKAMAATRKNDRLTWCLMPVHRVLFLCDRKRNGSLAQFDSTPRLAASHGAGFLRGRAVRPQIPGGLMTVVGPAIRTTAASGQKQTDGQISLIAKGNSVDWRATSRRTLQAEPAGAYDELQGATLLIAVRA